MWFDYLWGHRRTSDIGQFSLSCADPVIDRGVQCVIRLETVQSVEMFPD